MSTRFALIALGLGLAAPASSALAQSYNAPAGIPAATAPGGLEGRPAIPAASPYDAVATGSIGVRRAVRGLDRSADPRPIGHGVTNHGGRSGSPAC